MGFALSGTQGETVIESRSTAHRIVFAADRIRQEPRLEHTTRPSLIKKGAVMTVRWPNSALLSAGRCETAFFTNRRRFRLVQPAFDPVSDMERRDRGHAS